MEPFDPAIFRQRFPQFASFTDAQLEWFLDLAVEFFKNRFNRGLPETLYSKLLYLTVAHECQLQTTKQVGRVSSASTGSVSGSTEYQSPMGASQYWNQTQYGAQCYQLQKPFLTATWVSGNGNAAFGTINRPW